MLTRRQVGLAMVCAGLTSGTRARAAQPVADIALFRDATEVMFSVAAQRRAQNPAAPEVPSRYFVRDADEAHAIAFEGPAPIVGMSLDDLLDCARSSHPNAGQLVAIAGVHRGFLQLMAREEIRSISDLKGRRVAVDTDTGYASALFEMARQAGLERGRDYEVVYAGATNLRYAQLVKGAFDATLLGAPFTRLASMAGFSSLGSVIGALGGYQAVVFVARRPWLQANAPVARVAIDCLISTLAFARDPANRAFLVSSVQAALATGDAATAALVTDDLFGPQSEFLPDGRMRDVDIQVVVDLFNRSRGARLTLADVHRLTDTRLLPPAEAASGANR